MKLKQIRKQKGFTMIELVIVIAILGILAAFALPRFANFTTNARTASAQAITGTYNAGIGIVKAKFIANGSTGNTVTLEGSTYPIPVTPTGDLRLDSMDDCTNVAKGLSTLDFDQRTSNTSQLLYTLGYLSDTKECRVDNNQYGWRVRITSSGAVMYIDPYY